MKILVIRFSSIGDIVLTFPVLAAIKQANPQAEIHFASKKSFENLLQSTPHIDTFHFLNHSFPDFKKELKGVSFDYIVDLHNNLRSRRLTFGIKAKKGRLNKVNFKKYLLTKFKWNTLPTVHIVDRYLSTLNRLNIPFERQDKMQFIIPKDSQISIQERYPELGLNFVALAIGAKFETKKVPKNKWLEIIQYLVDPVVIIGGEMDRETAEWILKMSSKKTVVSTCGDLSILESASIASQAKSILTNDTGMMHIAACFDTQIISIWGNTVPEFGMSPYRPTQHKHDRIFQVEGLACRPCSKIGFSECPKKHFACMNQQDAQLIAASVRKN